MTGINHITKGEGEPVLMLHGWGGCIESFTPVIEELSKYRRVTAIDFPGFGKTPAPDSPLTVYDYADATADFIRNTEPNGTDIICHSFGGRVSILLAAKYPELTRRIVFTDAAGVLPRRGPKYYTKVYTYKLCKKAANNAFLGNVLKAVGIDVAKRIANSGSHDYKNLSGVMRATFVNIVNEDLKKYLQDIKSPSLMIYGINDTDTPVYMGETMKALIKDSGLVVLPNAGHFSYLDQFDAYMKIVKSFLEVG